MQVGSEQEITKQIINQCPKIMINPFQSTRMQLKFLIILTINLKS